ncbi:bacteriophage abortive infection AbiH family protein [Flavobacterium sp. XS2P24]|uniref:bacteriophage abortive infection AbiH family protein n=1 Tax=Flavobacterium sp. XS2P24 TaxID=3041249 RepID=UPI0024A83C05|nr:bacteriophage abortive infection AbiH family protein [Flavobacterium sp. XS2P24]MDI6048341.1 bacteriophage abortive infection AbiH family protein [Flavobacterium sp. XS2P24]
MKALYVIGNGFDMHHGLSTGYQFFHKYILQNQKELVDDLEKYFSFIEDVDKLWSSFEEDLKTFEFQSFYDDNCNVQIYDENFKPSLTYGLEDDINEQSQKLIESIRGAFESWIENIDIESVEKKLNIEENSFFINFNYTLLLEKTYQIQQDKIVHIHGDIENKQIVFGHNKVLEEDSEIDENGDSNRTLFSDSESAAKQPFHAFYKPVGDIIKENKHHFERFNTVKKIIVLGHSLKEIDIPYFEEILIHTNSAKWEVSYHEDKEEKEHLQKLQKIGINKKDIKLFRLD